MFLPRFICCNISFDSRKVIYMLTEMQSFRADIPELVRAHRKDDEHIETLNKSVNWLIQNACGPRLWIKWQKEINVLSELAYFATTTLAGKMRSFVSLKKCTEKFFYSSFFRSSNSRRRICRLNSSSFKSAASAIVFTSLNVHCRASYWTLSV